MRKGEKTRQIVVERAAALFNIKGYAGTSLQDIMEATGLSKGALYGRFRGGKEELAIASFDYAVEQVYEAVNQRTRTATHAVDKLEEVIRFYREHLFSPPIDGGCPIQNTSVEADDAHPTLRERVLGAINNWEQRIVHTLEKGKQRGQILAHTDSYAFATLFIGTLQGAILLARIRRDLSSFDTVVHPLCERLAALRTQTDSICH